MFLRCKVRRKDGKEHRTWSIVENRRVRGGKVAQRQVLYVGEINSSQREAWRKRIELFEEGSLRPRTASLFPAIKIKCQVQYRKLLCAAVLALPLSGDWPCSPWEGEASAEP